MVEVVEMIVARRFGVEVEDIHSRSQERSVSDARHFVWYILNTTLGIRPGIIAMTYNTSRQNIHYAIQLIRFGVQYQPFYARNYQAIIRELKTYNI